MKQPRVVVTFQVYDDGDTPNDPVDDFPVFYQRNEWMQVPQEGVHQMQERFLAFLGGLIELGREGMALKAAQTGE